MFYQKILVDPKLKNELQQQIQTDLAISMFFLARGALQYVGHGYNSAPLWQCPDMHRAILTTSI